MRLRGSALATAEKFSETEQAICFRGKVFLRLLETSQTQIAQSISKPDRRTCFEMLPENRYLICRRPAGQAVLARLRRGRRSGLHTRHCKPPIESCSGTERVPRTLERFLSYDLGGFKLLTGIMHFLGVWLAAWLLAFRITIVTRSAHSKPGCQALSL